LLKEPWLLFLRSILHYTRDKSFIHNSFIMFNSTFVSYEATQLLFYGQPLYVYFDIFAAILTFWLIIRIGRGKIRYPLIIFLAGFLSTLILPKFFVNDLETIMLFKGGVGLLGIASFVAVFGGTALFRYTKSSKKEMS
jgi:hypothetical protein